MKLHQNLKILEKKDFQVSQSLGDCNLNMRNLTLNELYQNYPCLGFIASYLSGLAPKKKFLTVDVKVSVGGKIRDADLNWQVSGNNDFFVAWVLGDNFISFARDEIFMSLDNDDSVLINDLLLLEEYAYMKKTINPPSLTVFSYSSRDVFKLKPSSKNELRVLVRVRSSDSLP